MAPPVKSSKLGYKESDETDAPSNNLWVGNLSLDVTDSDLMNLFANYGALDSVTTYSSRSYAFVYFKRVEDAAAAKDALQGTVLRGNPVKIEFARPAKPSKHIWVGGISPAVSKEQLEEEFLKFGKIVEFKFVRDRNIAFIEFVTLEDALEAMKNMNGKRIGGDQIRVDFLRSQSFRREQFSDFRDSKDGQFPVMHPGLRRAQPPGARKEGPPSNVLWVGYPPSLQIDEQMLHNAMILFGEIERIKSFPSRHYSFVEFRSVDEARRAKEGLQGRLFNDPRISIMYSSSDLAPGKEYSSFPVGLRGARPETLNEHIFGSSQLEMLDHHRPVGLHVPSGPLPPNSIHRSNLPLRPFGPQSGFEPVISGAEFNDLAAYNFRDGNSNISVGSNWRRPSSPAPGILPSPSSRMRPGARSVSTGWDVLDPNQNREPKRSRIDAPSPIDDDHGLGLEKTYRFVQGKHSLSPVGVRGTAGQHPPHVENDHIWRGIIAKGGTPVCHARCVPFDKGIEMELPEVVNCSARTGLDMLTKHYAEAIGFDVFFFLPDSEDDFASYTEFLRYLGSKDRAGVAKFDDGTTLFLVPPSTFLTDVLKVRGPERLYGVVLKLPQQVPNTAPVQPQLRQPNHYPQYVDRHQIPPPEADYNQVAQKEEHMMPMDYNRVLHEDSKLPPKSFYPPKTESVTEQSVPQDYASSNISADSQAGVSLTPELIATLSTLLPASTQGTPLEGGQPVSGSSAIRPSFPSLAADNRASHVWKHPGNTSHVQHGSQFNSQPQIQSMYQQPYPSIANVTNSSENMIPGSTQIQDSSANLPHLGGIPPRPLISTHSGPQVSQQYQVEVPHYKGYGGMALGTEASPVAYSPSVVQQSNSPGMFSIQPQGGNHPHTQPGVPLTADKVNWEIPNQAQQFQTSLSGVGQGTSEPEVDKNQRYRSTLQFAANLLLQIQQQQQQQQQQTGNAAVRGSGNQQ